MYIVLEDGLTEYHSLASLDFAPEADLIGDSLPICQFTADIITEDTIDRGQWAMLRDDLDNLWARYIITDADRLDRRTVRVTAKSPIYPVDRMRCDAQYYDAVPAEDVLAGILSPLDDTAISSEAYELDDALADTLITGFCPEQSARERLQWLCYVLGAVVRQAFSAVVRIAPLDAGDALIPLQRTYMRPTIGYKDIVTAVTVHAYTFTEGTPATTDEYVTDGATFWIVTDQKMTLANPNIPTGAGPNPVEIDGVYLINPANASAILARLGSYYFQRTTLDMACVANHFYSPGQRVTAYADRHTLMAGRIRSMRFAFGTQAKADMTLESAEAVEAATLTVLYNWQDSPLQRPLASATYTLPVGYAYSIDNPYIDQTIAGHRYIFRPETDALEGIMPAEAAQETVDMTPALDLYQGLLDVISVDSVTEEPGDDDKGNPITIGVIS